MDRVINLELLKHPMNWFVATFTVVVGMFILAPMLAPIFAPTGAD